MTFWSPPGHQAPADAWNYDLSSAKWVPPSQQAPRRSSQYSLGVGQAPPPGDMKGYHVLSSPPGVAAPRNAINYTPDTNEVSDIGVQAPVDKLNLSMIPVGGGGGVGVGQDYTELTPTTAELENAGATPATSDTSGAHEGPTRSGSNLADNPDPDSEPGRLNTGDMVRDTRGNVIGQVVDLGNGNIVVRDPKQPNATGKRVSRTIPGGAGTQVIVFNDGSTQETNIPNPAGRSAPQTAEAASIRGEFAKEIAASNAAASAARTAATNATHERIAAENNYTKATTQEEKDKSALALQDARAKEQTLLQDMKDTTSEHNAILRAQTTEEVQQIKDTAAERREMMKPMNLGDRIVQYDPEKGQWQVVYQGPQEPTTHDHMMSVPSSWTGDIEVPDPSKDTKEHYGWKMEHFQGEAAPEASMRMPWGTGTTEPAQRSGVNHILPAEAAPRQAPVAPTSSAPAPADFAAASINDPARGPGPTQQPLYRHPGGGDTPGQDYGVGQDEGMLGMAPSPTLKWGEPPVPDWPPKWPRMPWQPKPEPAPPPRGPDQWVQRDPRDRPDMGVGQGTYGREGNGRFGLRLGNFGAQNPTLSNTQVPGRSANPFPGIGAGQDYGNAYGSEQAKIKDSEQAFRISASGRADPYLQQAQPNQDVGWRKIEMPMDLTRWGGSQGPTSGPEGSDPAWNETYVGPGTSPESAQRMGGWAGGESSPNAQAVDTSVMGQREHGPTQLSGWREEGQTQLAPWEERGPSILSGWAEGGPTMLDTSPRAAFGWANGPGDGQPAPGQPSGDAAIWQQQRRAAAQRAMGAKRMSPEDYSQGNWDPNALKQSGLGQTGQWPSPPTSDVGPPSPELQAQYQRAAQLRQSRDPSLGAGQDEPLFQLPNPTRQFQQSQAQGQQWAQATRRPLAAEPESLPNYSPRLSYNTPTGEGVYAPQAGSEARMFEDPGNYYEGLDTLAGKGGPTVATRPVWQRMANESSMNALNVPLPWGNILDQFMKGSGLPDWRQEQPDTGVGQSGPPGGGAQWTPPVDPKSVLGTGHKFGEPVSQEGIHKGVDLQAPQGTPAKSPVDGVVARIDNNPKGLGITVTIRDHTGKEHTLGHLAKAAVKPGDRVKAGQPVGAVGSTGAATGAHLDYRQQKPNGQWQDPSAQLGQLAQMPRADAGADAGDMGEGHAPGPGSWTMGRGQDDGSGDGGGDGGGDPGPAPDDSGGGEVQAVDAPSPDISQSGTDWSQGGTWQPPQAAAAPTPQAPSQPDTFQYQPSFNDPGQQFMQAAWQHPEGQTPQWWATHGGQPGMGQYAQGSYGQQQGGYGPLGAKDIINPYDKQYLDYLKSSLAQQQGAEDNRHAEALKNLEQQAQQEKDWSRVQDAINAENIRHDQAQEEISKRGQDIQLQETQLQISSQEGMQKAGFHEEQIMSALKNPWLQALSGMTPEFGTPGGPSSQSAGGGAGSPQSFQQFQQMTPFQRAGWRTALEAQGPGTFENAQQGLRSIWGQQGQTQAPGMTALGAATQSPLDQIGTNQMADFFGSTPQQYWSQQQKQWAPGQQVGATIST